MNGASNSWPALPFAEWKDTAITLHLWTQIVGKIRLTLSPWINHSWHVTLYVTSRGLTTSPIPHSHFTFEIAFDFNEQSLDITTSDGYRRRIALRPRTVAGSCLHRLEAPLIVGGGDATFCCLPRSREATATR